MSSDFPRGWFQTTQLVGSGGVPSLTIPATPGIIHVLTLLESSIAQTAAGGGGTPYIMVDVGGGLAEVAQLALAPATQARDEVSIDLELPTLVGAALVVTWAAAFPVWPDGSAILRIAGYDI